MKEYIVTLTDSGEETVVGRYNTLAEAKQHLENVTFYPPHCRFESCLHIYDDGWSGSGQDEDGPFTYHIEAKDKHTPCVYALEMYRNELCRRFK